MEILNVDMYRDGGTITIRTDEGEICIDNGIQTKTPYQLYHGYPGRGNLVIDLDEIQKLIPIVEKSLEVYQYNHNTMQKCLQFYSELFNDKRK